MLKEKIKLSSFRIIFGLIFLTFGIILPRYVHFALTLAGHNLDYKPVALGMTFFSLLLCVSLALPTRIKLITTIVATLSITIVLAHFFFEPESKEITAELAGLYSSTEETTINFPENLIKYDLDWLELSLPGSWNKKLLDETGLVYFENNRSQQIRVSCSPPGNNLSNIIFRKITTQSDTVKNSNYSCRKYGDIKYCIFKTVTQENEHRWDYYLYRDGVKEIADISFVSLGKELFDIEEFQAITKSTIIKRKREKAPLCITTINWL